jgi:hypothetical protein
LFGKTLKAALSPEQWAKYDEDGNELCMRLYLSRLRWTASILQKSLALSDPQRFDLVVLLLEQTRPPDQFGPYDYYAIVSQMSQLPEARLMPLLNNDQRAALHREFAEVNQRVQSLKAAGHLPGDWPVQDRPGVAKRGAEPASGEAAKAG